MVSVVYVLVAFGVCLVLALIGALVDRASLRVKAAWGILQLAAWIGWSVWFAWHQDPGLLLAGLIATLLAFVPATEAVHRWRSDVELNRYWRDRKAA